MSEQDLYSRKCILSDDWILCESIRRSLQTALELTRYISLKEDYFVINGKYGCHILEFDDSGCGWQSISHDYNAYYGDKFKEEEDRILACLNGCKESLRIDKDACVVCGSTKECSCVIFGNTKSKRVLTAMSRFNLLACQADPDGASVHTPPGSER
jgi:hypothetical protein